MLEFSSALCTKLACGWIGRAAGRTIGSGDGRLRFAFARRNLAADQGIEIRGGFDILDLLKHPGRFRTHFAADFLVVLLRQLPALVFEIEVLNVAENDFLLALKQVPSGLFDDGG